MERNPLVSIILPVYNGETYIADAVQSVMHQSYRNWELLIINDGSTDDTLAVVKKFPDKRIHLFNQINKGVSAARNTGFQNMKGDYFCFLDADDMLPPKSIETRLKVFKTHPDTEFVDGVTEVKNSDLTKTLFVFEPRFTGNPHNELLKLSDKCFFGPTWFIKRNNKKGYHMNETLTHGEDLLFYIEISTKGTYRYVNDKIYIYRKSANSAMTNLKGLEKGYIELWKIIRQKSMYNKKQLFLLRLKIKKIMLLSYLKNRQPVKALKTLIRPMK
ncbi:MAG: glycosyltransferase family 2 protein [Bacteroidota bacterium]